ncbi:hypothetical protein LOTGIDRAFT_102728 [Lottia gigantea]|uniref:Lipase domain-containing protein n=1 Tax=Lottia gigantea TaxID=225164 RepID=V4CRQ0_LOTGI|nr:hypothetical protein LOTGIDRAFT_102728 [Lottia gigantea]ESP05200.1 hypothetical protein LOTGIDRAFT_102728 [Lottia gigantea]
MIIDQRVLIQVIVLKGKVSKAGHFVKSFFIHYTSLFYFIGYSFFNYESSKSFSAYKSFERLTSGSLTGTGISGAPSLVCYDNLGCFNNFPPFHNDVLPQSPLDQNLAYVLFTQKNPLVPQLLDCSSPETIAVSNFDNSKKIYVIIHGYKNTGLDIWVRQMAAQILTKEDANVIAVEWSKGASGLYKQAAANSRIVGASVAAMLDKLASSNLYTIFTPHHIHIIGHGVGAHAAGFAGKKSPWIGRITGLDPAGPLFEDVSAWARLDSFDAQIVDVIHTDTPGNGQIGLGISKSIGSVDFYPNGGIDQPGCPPAAYSLEDFLLGNIDAIACDHLRAIDYFVASINNCEFLAVPCDESIIRTAPLTCNSCGYQGCARMGFNYSPTSSFGRGSYFLLTTPTFPFCIA